MNTNRKGDPDSPHWWLRPMGLEELVRLIECVKDAHIRGLGFASVTMNRIQIALEELRERKEKDEREQKAQSDSLLGSVRNNSP